MSTLISVVIATKNEEKNIGKCLDSVKDQASVSGETEIIVVDNNSSDKTKEIARKYTKNIFDFGPERSAQRNYGAKKASGKYVLYLDADMRLSRNVLSECEEEFRENPDLVALYIPEKIVGRGFWGKARNFERSFYDGTPIDATRFIRRDKFLEAGGFDEKLYAAEDWDLDKRLKKLGGFDIINSSLVHDERDFALAKYLAKKKYYIQNFDAYISKWGKADPEIRKQFGFYYRLIGVFTENGKWENLIRHPALFLGMYFLRFLVGIKFLTRQKVQS